MTRAAAAGLVLTALLLAGCTGGEDPEPAAPAAGIDVDSPLADCAGLTEPPPQPSPPSEVGFQDMRPRQPYPGEPLPALTLPCFTGGEPFDLADLRGPAVVNLWATWCTPCREELPELQRFADRAAGQVHVLGVITQDPRPAAAADFAADLGITFPALYDRDGQLLAAMPGIGLPMTLFVDATGQVAYLHQGQLDEAAVASLATEHLGAS